MARFVFEGPPSGSLRRPLAASHLFQTFASRSRGAFFSGDEGHGPRQRPGYLVTPELSLSCPMHAGKENGVSSKNVCAVVKQAAYGETLTAIIKKKLMKNKLSVEASAPANASQLSSSRTERVSFKHHANRELPTQKVLDLLKTQLPRQYELAEIVGKWIWLDFPAASHRAAAKTLYHLGFHWNQRRCVWQHPCGAFAPYSPHPTDPRTKYGSHFAADSKPA